MQLDELAQRLQKGMERKLLESRAESHRVVNRLRPEILRTSFALNRDHLDDLTQRLVRSNGRVLADTRTVLNSLVARLDDLSPLAVLSRGYSIAFRSTTDQVITDAATVNSGDEITVRLRAGSLDCVVQDRTLADLD